jgi:hypothetical protein
VLLAVPVLAQDDASEEEAAPAGPSFRPIEIYACNFNEGQTMADLKAAIAGWTAWMDENERTTYWAALLLPMYHSAEITFDVGWVGGWPSGAVMAQSTEFWLANGSEHRAAFERVLDCSQHVNFAVYTVQPDPEPFSDGPVEFSNCTVAEGKNVADIAGLVHQWAAHEGAANGHFMLFPAFGEASDAEYDFKWVSVSSYEALGAAYDDFTTGGGYEKYGELFGDEMECDSSRLYHAISVRKVDLGG